MQENSACVEGVGLVCGGDISFRVLKCRMGSLGGESLIDCRRRSKEGNKCYLKDKPLSGAHDIWSRAIKRGDHHVNWKEFTIRQLGNGDSLLLWSHNGLWRAIVDEKKLFPTHPQPLHTPPLSPCYHLEGLAKTIS